MPIQKQLADIVGSGAGRSSSARNAARRQGIVADALFDEVGPVLMNQDVLRMLPEDLQARVMLGDPMAALEATQYILRPKPVPEMPVSPLREAADRTARAYAGDQFVNLWDSRRGDPRLADAMVNVAYRNPGRDVALNRLDRLGEATMVDKNAYVPTPEPMVSDDLIQRLGMAGLAGSAIYGASRLGQAMFNPEGR